MDIVIVGGGPAGLFASIRLAAALPSARVVVYEKRPVYTRKQTVVLGGELLEDLKKIGVDPSGWCFMEKRTHTNRCVPYHEADSRSAATPPISALEDEMKRVVSRLPGLRLVVGEVPPDAVRLADVVVFADGNRCESLRRFFPRRAAERSTPVVSRVAIGVVPCRGRAALIGTGGRKTANRGGQEAFRLSIVLRPSPYLYVAAVVPPHEVADRALVAARLSAAIRYHGLETACPLRKDQPIDIVEVSLRALRRPAFRAGGQRVFVIGDASFNTHFFSGQGVRHAFRCVDAMIRGCFSVRAYNAFSRRLREENLLSLGEVLEPCHGLCRLTTKKRLREEARQKGLRVKKNMTKEDLCVLNRVCFCRRQK